MQSSVKKMLNAKWMPFILAAIIAASALIWYILSGRGSLDTNLRSLSEEKTIKKIEAADAKNIVITCKNGQIYKIAFTEDRQNYDDLVFNACGEEGTQASGN